MRETGGRSASLSSACFTLAGAVAVNSASVVAEQRWHLHTRVFGRWAALVHATLIVPPWIAFLVVSAALPRDDLSLSGVWSSRVGGMIQGAGLLVSLIGFRQLGWGALVNLDQFQAPALRSVTGIYGVLEDPIYTGYAVATAGAALRHRSCSGLVIAGLMYALLTRVQSPIEGWAAASITPRTSGG